MILYSGDNISRCGNRNKGMLFAKTNFKGKKSFFSMAEDGTVFFFHSGSHADTWKGTGKIRVLCVLELERDFLTKLLETFLKFILLMYSLTSLWSVTLFPKYFNGTGFYLYLRLNHAQSKQYHTKIFHRLLTYDILSPTNIFEDV
jgi:hypothetical protein